MNIRFKLLIIMILMTAVSVCFGQSYQINTLFKGPKNRGNGGYGALTNKFTRIKGQYANMAEVYGGVYINHRFLLGLSVAAVTNNLPVPAKYSVNPSVDMSWEYGQFGLMTEYTLWSNRAIHLSFHAMNGAGFTVQYQRHPDSDYVYWDSEDYQSDANWFFVTEPGIRLEMNVLKWLRVSPGVSYRAAFKADAQAHTLNLTNDDINGYNLNLTLKFGKF